MNTFSWSFKDNNQIKLLRISVSKTGYTEIICSDEDDKFEGSIEFPNQEIDMIIRVLTFLKSVEE